MACFIVFSLNRLLLRASSRMLPSIFGVRHVVVAASPWKHSASER
jgi:hypothetical protein